MHNYALENLVEKYISASGTEKKMLLERILAVPDSERRIYSMIFSGPQRAALRALADACRKKNSREIIKPLAVRDAGRLLSVEDDKARKTAVVLIGLCAPGECAERLSQALKNERIRFVRPSIILALGNTPDPAKYLKDYVIEPGEEKHVREEAEALKKALSKGLKPELPPELDLPEKCALTSINRNALRLELSAKDCKFTNSGDIRGAFEVKTKEMTGLRCYSDALYYIGEIGSYKLAAEALDSIGLNKLGYRIEAGYYSQEKREGIIREISEGLSEYGYIDNPSAYSFEIRVIGKKLYAVFRDKRFEYRKQSIAASINPVAAASIMRICLPCMKEEASVLDPFCGSGTMLIERGYIKKTSSLVGVDISNIAIKAACENRKASGLKIALIKGDILGYGGAKYDEIISNMPFGIRVSGHNSNIRLYKAFADKLESLLKEGGAAFLFTQEKKLLRETIRNNKCFSIIKEEVFETGGLSPTLFIIKKETVK